MRTQQGEFPSVKNIDPSEPSKVRPGSSSWRQLMMVLWKNIYLKRLCRHYTTTLLEIVLMVVLLLGIQEDSVVREPFLRRGDTVFMPIHSNAFWNTQPDMAHIQQVYFEPVANKYIAWLTRSAMMKLGVPNVSGLPSKKDLVAAMLKQNQTPVTAVGLAYANVGAKDVSTVPISLRVTFFGGRLPFDVKLLYSQRILSEPAGPAAEQRFPEMNTFLPIIGALQQLHLERQAALFNYTQRLNPPVLRRFSYPSYIEHKDTKNYALVLTRFCIGMLIPFAVFVARLSEEKSTGMKELLRICGLNDWVYWLSHYISGFFMHLIIVTLMMLFLCVKRNEEGRAFIQFSDPLLVFCILMCFCSSCLWHATLLSMFFQNPHSAVAGAMLYWTFSCLMPFLVIENAGGQGYHFIQRWHKLATSVFPGMSLHWSFRVLERFEKFVDYGANWANFYDHDATPDNVTLGEIVFVGVLCDCVIILLVWYLDNVAPAGPGIAKPLRFPFQMTYWVPSITILSPPELSPEEVQNFETEPKDEAVSIDVFHVTKDYDGVVAVQNVNMRIFENQITVLLGHNGAGKTTLLNMITGFTGASAGTVVIGGYDILTCTKDARESIGFCAQHNILFDDLTVEEHLLFFAVLKGTPYSAVRLEVVTMLHDVGLINCRSELAVNLSLGLQRRLCTALAIISKPKVIILDEPTANMDPEGRREMWELLLKIRRSCAIFLTTQHLDEADVLGDRIAVMASARIRQLATWRPLVNNVLTGAEETVIILGSHLAIYDNEFQVNIKRQMAYQMAKRLLDARCIGSPTFLKHRFGTGYHMLINKASIGCKVPEIEALLHKYSPKTRLQSDSDNKAVFLLGQVVATRRIIAMFKDLEKRSEELGIESVGMMVTSLEDVLIRVGEEHHLLNLQLPQLDAAKNEESVIQVKESVVRMMATTLSADPGLMGRVWALLAKRAICAWRQKKQPLFSWLLPPLLLSLLFLLENQSMRRTERAVENVGNSFLYTYGDLGQPTQGFIQLEDRSFFDKYILPALPNNAYFQNIPPTADVVQALLAYAKEQFRFYVFGVQLGLEMINETSGTLWYNGEIQHGAPLLITLYNEARLQYVTGLNDAVFRFEVMQLDYGLEAAEDEHTVRHSMYREVTPKVLRSIFLPMVSSLMCSNFVLFPISERALQVKHLHVVAGVGPTLYWATSFLWDFMFYMGTAIFVLPPYAYFKSRILDFNYMQLVFLLNILHGFAALPFIYVCSFFFDNPGFGFSTLAISTFIISALCCLGSVFMEHYAESLQSFPLTVFVEFMLQVARLLPNYSYSRGMNKLLQLAAESTICRAGAQALISECRSKTIEAKQSAKQCCEHVTEPDPSMYAIGPLDVHPYSAFFEVATLFVEGPLLFILILIGERYWLRQIYRHLTAPDSQNEFNVHMQPAAHGLRAGKAKAAKHEDTDVVKEDKLVTDLVYQQLPPPDNLIPAMIVCRLKKAYGYTETNIVLQGLSFTLRSGECFGLLGVNGAGKTTTFKILTGQILPHGGDAFIAAFSVVQDGVQFRRYLGYCPQREGLLDMLTGVETILLYTRLRGIPLTKDYLDTLMDIFHLDEIKDHLVSTYSAGNKRKLSLCICMIGMPKVMLLDEPYASIGATSRKRIVNYISALQRVSKVSMVLTSHSLSDVEFLCNRMAILGGGKLQCLGSLAHLKEKFGKGYTIMVKAYPDKKQDFDYQREVAQTVRRVFRRAELVHSYEGLLEFRMSHVRMLWSDMFSGMAAIKKKFKLQDFFITDTSLEQIFLSVTRKEASEAAAAAEAPKTGAITNLGI